MCMNCLSFLFHVYQVLLTFVNLFSAFTSSTTGRRWGCTSVSPIRIWKVSRSTIVEWQIVRRPCCGIGFALGQPTSRLCSWHWARWTKHSRWALCTITGTCAICNDCICNALQCSYLLFPALPMDTHNYISKISVKTIPLVLCLFRPLTEPLNFHHYFSWILAVLFILDYIH